MGRYFDAMRAQVERRGGRVEKFIGDAVVAVFGVPSAHEDDVDRALGCALAMRRELERLNDAFTAERGIRLQLRIGVTTGEVLAAAVAARPEEGLVTGDAVTIAARLQEVAETGQVLVAARTAVASRSFAFRSLGERRLKGRSAPMQVLELVGEAARPLGPEWSAPLVDREEPLAALERSYDRAVQARTPVLVTMYGEPGVGKSRLASEFVARLLKAETPPPGGARPLPATGRSGRVRVARRDIEGRGGHPRQRSSGQRPRSNRCRGGSLAAGGVGRGANPHARRPGAHHRARGSSAFPGGAASTPGSL